LQFLKNLLVTTLIGILAGIIVKFAFGYENVEILDILLSNAIYIGIVMILSYVLWSNILIKSN